MEIRQFFDKTLAHSSYAIYDEGEMVLIDPARDPKPYYDFADKKKAKITSVIETHPHADFVSSHYQINQDKSASVFASKLVGADYPHQSLDEGEYVRVGSGKLVAMHTPGHSPDSISLLLKDRKGKSRAVFTGDSLFIGDVGRPDLREKAGNMKAKREELAKDMYHTMQNKFKPLKDSLYVYPAHGAGSLCGKNMSSDTYSTIGEQRKANWAFGKWSEQEFMDHLLEDQPFIPKYFGYAVDLNKQGPPSIAETLKKVNWIEEVRQVPADALVIDIRDEEEFKKGHLPGSLNLMEKPGNKFETWLGSVVDPNELYFLLGDDKDQLERALGRAAKIGYEANINSVVFTTETLPETMPSLNYPNFKKHPNKYTIVDVRNASEVKSEGLKFKNALNIPLPELRERALEVPTDKPVVVHCAAGFRSAMGSSILKQRLEATVHDLSDRIKDYK